MWVGAQPGPPVETTGGLPPLQVLQPLTQSYLELFNHFKKGVYSKCTHNLMVLLDPTANLFVSYVSYDVSYLNEATYIQI